MIPSKDIDWNSEEIKLVAIYKRLLEDSVHAVNQYFRGILTYDELLDHLEQDNTELNSILKEILSDRG
jgi:hypothetical protein